MIRTQEHNAKIGLALRDRVVSAETRAKLREAALRRCSSNGAVERECAWCGARFVLAKPSARNRFCSPSCGYAARRGARARNWREDMPVIQCSVCGLPVRMPARSSAAFRRTCSYECKNILKLQEHPQPPTVPERLLAAAFMRLEMQAVPQHPMLNLMTVDFFIPAARAVVFCDGDYWHSLPVHKERDARQDRALQEAGYRVLRLAASAIERDADACARKVAAICGRSSHDGRARGRGSVSQVQEDDAGSPHAPAQASLR